MYGIYIYANIGGILMVNVTIYSIHGSYGIVLYYWVTTDCGASHFPGNCVSAPPRPRLAPEPRLMAEVHGNLHQVRWLSDGWNDGWNGWNRWNPWCPDESGATIWLKPNSGITPWKSLGHVFYLNVKNPSLDSIEPRKQGQYPPLFSEIMKEMGRSHIGPCSCIFLRWHRKRPI